jgi:hypothetical protein
MAGYEGGLTDVPPFPPFTDGIVLAGSPHAGELFAQGEVEHESRRVRLDDVHGPGWQLVTLGATRLESALAEWFAAIGGRVIAFGGRDPDAVDIDGTYGKWFAEHGVMAALQRPDFVLFGTAKQTSEVPDLVRSLRTALATPEIDFPEVV